MVSGFACNTRARVLRGCAIAIQHSAVHSFYVQRVCMRSLSLSLFFSLYNIVKHVIMIESRWHTFQCVPLTTKYKNCVCVQPSSCQTMTTTIIHKHEIIWRILALIIANARRICPAAAYIIYIRHKVGSQHTQQLIAVFGVQALKKSTLARSRFIIILFNADCITFSLVCVCERAPI